MSAFDGTWITVTNTPMGEQRARLILVSDGDSLSGTSTGTYGVLPIADGKQDSDRASWTLALTAPFPMTLAVEVQVDGDTLSGGVTAGTMGTSPLTGAREA